MGRFWSSPILQLMGEKNQKCLFTDSLHRLGSLFARTSSVPLEIKLIFAILKGRPLHFHDFLTAISFAIAVLQSTAGGELFKYCNSRLHNGVCNCTTHYFALLSLTELQSALLSITEQRWEALSSAQLCFALPCPQLCLAELSSCSKAEQR